MPSSGAVRRPSQNCSAPMPALATALIAVMATRRRVRWLRSSVIGAVRLLELALDEVEGGADGLDALQLLLLDRDVELLLEGHDQLDQVEAVGIEVVGRSAEHTS